MQVKVINIQPNCPPYEYLSSEERPEHYWEKPDGSWLGFWYREWPDLLGTEILKQTDRFDWEVWQPDLRADRTYSKTMETGVIHRLFPAKAKKYRPGFKTQLGVFSAELLSQVKSAMHQPVILQLHGFRNPFLAEILKEVGAERKCPICLITHGTVTAPLEELLELHRLTTYIDLLMEQKHYKEALRHNDIIVVQNQSSRRSVRKMFKGRVEQVTMGCDFDFWKPVESLERKNEIHEKLHISTGVTLFFTASRLVPLKQLDKLIYAFHSLSHRNDFFLLIAGEGDADYKAYLNKRISDLSMNSRVRLHPYVTGDELRNLYWSADVYVSVSKAEGCSVAVMKAMACGLPVLCTPVGGTSELMQKYEVGLFVPVKHYSKWVEAIKKILDGGAPSLLDIDVARTAYDWPIVARQFINIYEKLCSRS